jgi:hypothetical protein
MLDNATGISLHQKFYDAVDIGANISLWSRIQFAVNGPASWWSRSLEREAGKGLTTRTA